MQLILFTAIVSLSISLAIALVHLPAKERADIHDRQTLILEAIANQNCQ